MAPETFSGAERGPTGRRACNAGPVGALCSHDPHQPPGSRRHLSREAKRRARVCGDMRSGDMLASRLLLALSHCPWHPGRARVSFARNRRPPGAQLGRGALAHHTPPLGDLPGPLAVTTGCPTPPPPSSLHPALLPSTSETRSLCANSAVHACSRTRTCAPRPRAHTRHRAHRLPLADTPTRVCPHPLGPARSLPDFAPSPRTLCPPARHRAAQVWRPGGPCWAVAAAVRGPHAPRHWVPEGCT